MNYLLASRILVLDYFLGSRTLALKYFLRSSTLAMNSFLVSLGRNNFRVSWNLILDDFLGF